MPQVTRPEVWRRFWKEQGVYVLEHSPYSPDLVPFDFFLFPRLKKLGVSILNLLRGIPQKDYEKVFKDWIKNLKFVYLWRDGILTIWNKQKCNPTLVVI